MVFSVMFSVVKSFIGGTLAFEGSMIGLWYASVTARLNLG